MQYQQRLDDIERRFDELNAQMADPAIISDAAQYRKITKAHSELAGVVAKYREWKAASGNLHHFFFEGHRAQQNIDFALDSGVVQRGGARSKRCTCFLSRGRPTQQNENSGAGELERRSQHDSEHSFAADDVESRQAGGKESINNSLVFGKIADDIKVA